LEVVTPPASGAAFYVCEQCVEAFGSFVKERNLFSVVFAAVNAGKQRRVYADLRVRRVLRDFPKNIARADASERVFEYEQIRLQFHEAQNRIVCVTAVIDSHHSRQAPQQSFEAFAHVRHIVGDQDLHRPIHTANG
jgi:hypothetical protein